MTFSSAHGSLKKTRTRQSDERERTKNGLQTLHSEQRNGREQFGRFDCNPPPAVFWVRPQDGKEYKGGEQRNIPPEADRPMRDEAGPNQSSNEQRRIGDCR